MSTAPPNGVGFQIFAVATEAPAPDYVILSWQGAGPCEDCGAESGEVCRWQCLGRPEDTVPSYCRMCDGKGTRYLEGTGPVSCSSCREV